MKHPAPRAGQDDKSQVRGILVLHTMQGVMRPKGFWKQHKRPLDWELGGRGLLPKQRSWHIPHGQRQGLTRGPTTSHIPLPPLPGFSDKCMHAIRQQHWLATTLKSLPLVSSTHWSMSVYEHRCLCGTTLDKPFSALGPCCLDTKT